MYRFAPLGLEMHSVQNTRVDGNKRLHARTNMNHISGGVSHRSRLRSLEAVFYVGNRRPH